MIFLELFAQPTVERQVPVPSSSSSSSSSSSYSSSSYSSSSARNQPLESLPSEASPMRRGRSAAQETIPGQETNRNSMLGLLTNAGVKRKLPTDGVPEPAAQTSPADGGPRKIPKRTSSATGTKQQQIQNLKIVQHAGSSIPAQPSAAVSKFFERRGPGKAAVTPPVPRPPPSPTLTESTSATRQTNSHDIPAPKTPAPPVHGSEEEDDDDGGEGDAKDAKDWEQKMPLAPGDPDYYTSPSESEEDEGDNEEYAESSKSKKKPKPRKRKGKKGASKDSVKPTMTFGTPFFHSP